MTTRMMIVLGFVALGCGGSSTSQTVIHHASTAWKCPAGDIRVERLDSETYRAEGCERQADYSCPTNGGNNRANCERVSGT